MSPGIASAVSPVTMMLFQNRIAEGADTDQRGAASPHAQEILCRSFTRPTDLWVSGIGVLPQAQRKISSRDMLMIIIYTYLSMSEGRVTFEFQCYPFPLHLYLKKGNKRVTFCPEKPI